jgi:hypothetical protein
VQQDLHLQGSGAAAVVEDTATLAASDPAGGADTAAQADGDGWVGEHTINVRLTIPLLSDRYYLTILGGKERRNPKRRRDERRKNPLATRWNIAFLAVLGLITGLALFTVIQFAARFVLERAGVV